MRAMTTRPVAEAAREASRQADGKFGTQPLTEADLDLQSSGSGSEAVTGLRFGTVYTETDAQGVTRQHADLLDPALAARIADFQSAHGYEVTGEQVRVRTAMDSRSPASLCVQLSLDGGTTWEDELTADRTPVAATVSNLLSGYDRADGRSVPWRRDDIVTAPQRPLIFSSSAGAVERANRFDDVLHYNHQVDPAFLEDNYIASLTDMARRVSPDTNTVDPSSLHRAVNSHFEEIRQAVAGKADADSVAVREGAAEAMAQVLERGELKSTGRRRVIAHQLTLALAQNKTLDHALDHSCGPIDEHRLQSIYNGRFTG